MNEVILTSWLMTVSYAALAVVGGWWLLRLLDRIGGVNFKETVGRITSEPLSAAIYFGLRFLGVCLLLGMVIS